MKTWRRCGAFFSRRWREWGLSLLGIALVVAGSYTWRAAIGEWSEQLPPAGRVVGWIPYWEQEAAVGSFERHRTAFAELGLFWYYARPDGTVARYAYAREDQELVARARAQGVSAMIIITNLPDGEESEWDAELVQQVIGTVAARRRHTAEIVALVERLGVDGVQIDYEALRAEQRADFTRFVRLLAHRLHRRGKRLGVALMPKLREGDPAFSNGSEAQDWRRLSRYADELYVMAYGEHWDGSAAGSAASRPWVRAVGSYARQLIPLEKLYLGLPLYGYDWGGAGPAEGLTYEEARRRAATREAAVQWDETAASATFVYADETGEHTVWFEDARSTAAKVAAARSLGITRFALWRLGGEDPQTWEAFRTAGD